MGKSALIIIHGVGDSPRGASLREASFGLHARGVAGVRADLMVEGVRFPRILVEHPEFDEIIEVNWSDVARPARSALALLAYCVRIVIALLEVGSAPDQSDKPRGHTFLTRAYRNCFEALLVYCIYPPLVSVFWMTIWPGQWLATVAIGSVGAITVAALTWYLSRFKGAFWFGWLWAGAIAGGATALATGRLSLDAAVRTASIAYVLSQSLTGTLLFAALLYIGWRRSEPGDRRVARLALLYSPLFIISTVGAIMWMITLAAGRWLSRDTDRFEQWQKRFSQALRMVGYDLALTEYTFAVLVSLIGLGMLGVVLTYWVRARTPARNSQKRAGEFARDGMKHVAAAGAVLFGSLVVVYTVSGAISWTTGQSEFVLEVYSLSSLRIVPYLPLTIGPLAMVAGIIVDILFYIVPRDSGLSTATVLRDRLRTVIEYTRSRREGPIVVAAHSQGSVIAVDVIGREMSSEPGGDSRLFLITAGSPVASLYQRFLGSTPESRANAEQCTFAPPSRWVNFWREGDYIGAEQCRPGVKEINLGVGGHTGYWRDRVLWRRVLADVIIAAAGR